MKKKDEKEKSIPENRGKQFRSFFQTSAEILKMFLNPHLK